MQTTEPTADTSLRCTVCDKHGAAISKGCVCRSTAYCSKQCQDKDEAIHNILCKNYAEMKNIKERPTPTAVIAIYFPLQGIHCKATDPELIWFERTEAMKVEIDKVTGKVVRTPCLGKDIPKPAETVFHRNMVENFQIDHTLCVTYRQAMRWEAINVGSRINLSIVEITNGDVQDLWKGPVVLCSLTGTDTMKGEGKIQDVKVADLRTAIDFFTKYMNDADIINDALMAAAFWELELSNPKIFNSMLSSHNKSGKVVKGVEITCLGDRKLLHIDQEYIEVNVPENNPIFHCVRISQPL